jgi:hypothetical protein
VWVYMPTVEYYSAIKKISPSIWDSMGEPAGHYGQWNKPDIENQILHDFSYMGDVLIEAASTWQNQ